MAEDQIDLFMAAIRRLESGSFKGNYNAVGPVTSSGDRAYGAYQIMGRNWPSWSAAAGIPGADWRDPAAQDRVARYMMTNYYRKYGSWDLVSVAWFGGGGAADEAMAAGLGTVASRADVTGFSIGDYVPQIQEYMAEASGGAYTPPSSSAPAQAPSVYSPSWVQTMAENVSVEDQKLRSSLIDTLNVISSAAAGGTRTLPAMNTPDIVGGLGDVKKAIGKESGLGDA